MPDKKSKEKKSGDGADEDAEKSGGKGKLLPAIVLSVGLLGAGYFVGGGGGGGSTAAPVAEASAEVVEEEEHHELGTLVGLDAINVNLAEGHFLRIAVTLELSAEKSEYVAAKVKKDKTYAFPSAPAADMVLAVFSGRSMDDLQTPEGREEARLALEEAVHGIYGEDVTHIYLTEFVMQ